MGNLLIIVYKESNSPRCTTNLFSQIKKNYRASRKRECALCCVGRIKFSNVELIELILLLNQSEQVNETETAFVQMAAVNFQCIISDLVKQPLKIGCTIRDDPGLLINTKDDKCHSQAKLRLVN